MRLKYSLASLILVAITAQPVTGAGRVEKVVVHGSSLEGALLGYSADRDVFVYLPPGYRASGKRRYPVVYSLHGFGGSGETWVKRLGAPESFDRAIAAGVREMIVVMPDARTPLGGSMFSSSVTTGDWETFIASDLVKYMDSHYRTLATRDSRGLSGFSMGGYGTLRIAMKRPEAFSSIYAMSSCCLQPPLPPLTQPEAFAGFAGLEQIKTPEAAATLEFGAVPFAMAAAWSPNPGKPPLFLDLPTLGGKPQANVIAAWSANTPLAMVHQYVPALKSLKFIAFEVGKQDGLLGDNERLHAILDGYGIVHHFEAFEGGHGDLVPLRFEQLVLPFFSQHLRTQDH